MFSILTAASAGRSATGAGRCRAGPVSGRDAWWRRGGRPDDAAAAETVAWSRRQERRAAASVAATSAVITSRRGHISRMRDPSRGADGCRTARLSQEPFVAFGRWSSGDSIQSVRGGAVGVLDDGRGRRLELLERRDEPRAGSGSAAPRSRRPASSRLRLMANCISCAASGARISSTMRGDGEDDPEAAVVAALVAVRRRQIQKRSPMLASSATAPTGDDRDGGSEDVVVLDVGELVGEHAFELDPVHLLEQAGGDGQRRRAWGCARWRTRSGPGRRRRRAGAWGARGDAEALDEVVVAAGTRVRRRDGPAPRPGRPCRSCSTRRTRGSRR